jgi:hypothetical protein
MEYLAKFLQKIKLNGKFSSFNVALAIALLIILSAMKIVLSIEDKNLSGHLISILVYGTLGIIFLGMLFYFLRPEKSNENKTIIKASNSRGQSIHLEYVNAPALNSPQLSHIMRNILVGYDANLEPDGEVIGNLSNKNIRLLSDEERALFKENNINAIRSKLEFLNKLESGTSNLQGKVGSSNTEQAGSSPV